MEASQFHLLINHYPMIVSFIGAILLLIGVWRKNDRVNRISLWLFFAEALLSVAVFWSGEVAGRNSGMLADPAGNLLRQHQEAARLTFLLIGSTGLTSVFGLIMLYRRSYLARLIVPLVLVLSIVGTAFVTYTTIKGRQIKFGNTSVINSTSTNSQ